MSLRPRVRAAVKGSMLFQDPYAIPHVYRVELRYCALSRHEVKRRRVQTYEHVEISSEVWASRMRISWKPVSDAVVADASSVLD